MKPITRLDCESTDSLCASLSAFSGLSSQEILTKLGEFSGSADDKLASDDRWQAIANWLCVPENPFEVCWFHGTRTANPDSFTTGLLPLDERLDEIWNEMAALIRDKVGARQFICLRRAVERDNYGTGSIPDVINSLLRNRGPHAWLIKAMAVNRPSKVMHNYSHVPEIVERILSSFPEPHRAELNLRFFQTTNPCVVKFFSDEIQREIVGCAADYLLHLHLPNRYPLKLFMPIQFNGAGHPVPKHRIIYATHINAELMQR